MANQRLERLWNRLDYCPSCAKQANPLRHLPGGGQENRPYAALVFINPTHRNISTHPDWKGPRYPFLGTREIWRVLGRAGFLGAQTVSLTQGEWTRETSEQVLRSIRDSGLYLTNVVKCTKPNGDNPSAQEVRAWQDVLGEELSIVRPRLVVAMGILPFKALTGQPINLGEHFQAQRKSPGLLTFEGNLGEAKQTIYPCYFPVGRGNPKRAVELLSRVVQDETSHGGAV